MFEAQHNGSELVKAHIPCPHCGSKDNAAEYTDHYYCFGCEKVWRKEAPSKAFSSSSTTLVQRGSYRDLPDRGLTEATCRKFGVKSVKTQNGVVEHIYPYYDKEGNLIALKTRKIATKEFSWEGNGREATLFGQQLFPKGGKFVTICEGCLDCMAAYQMFGGVGAYVSVKNGAKDIKTIKENYEWLNSFETIIVCFDGDKVGREAAKKVAEILPPVKTKIMKMSESTKDANAFLLEGRQEEFRKLWWSAEEYRPEDVINISQTFERVMEYRKTHQYIPTPWEGLNDMIQGVRAGQMVILSAGSGAGKSSFMRSWMVDTLSKHPDKKVGCLFMEESIEETIVSLMSLAAGKNLKRSEVWDGCSKEELQQCFKDVTFNGRIEMFEPKEQTTPQYITNKIRYLVAARGCELIFLDHLSILVDATDDIRKELNRLCKEVHEICVSLGVIVIAAIHLRKSQSGKDHESGAVVRLDDIKDSSSVKQLADVVVAFERDGQSEDPIVANTTRVRVLKNRDFGTKGVACGLLYDNTTTRLQEVPKEVIEGEF